MNSNADNDSKDELLSPTLIRRILSDPKLLEELDRQVYELLKNDLRQQRERQQNYRR